MAPRWPFWSLSASLRIAALIAYDGTDFAGFQRQASDRTVQGELERALGALYQQAVVVRGAGRTDAGVHARGQVIAFDAPDAVPAERVPLGLRGHLPADVAMRRAWAAESGFDPRRDALQRVYRYTLVADELPDPLRDRFVTRVRPGLDLARMREATAPLAGEHDFGSFCCENGASGSTRRVLRSAQWEAAGELWCLQLVGDSFLYKQVRCTVGVLLAIGAGRYGPELVEQMLEGAPRPDQVTVAPPTGLVLERVVYGPGPGRTESR